MLNIPELKGKRTATVSFAEQQEADVEKAFSTTGKMGRASHYVYSIVANALSDKFQDYDAYYFSALERHSGDASELDSKAKIYLHYANIVAKRHGVRVYEDRSNYGKAFLISKIPIESEQFFNEALEFMKNSKLYPNPIFKRSTDM